MGFERPLLTGTVGEVSVPVREYMRDSYYPSMVLSSREQDEKHHGNRNGQHQQVLGDLVLA